MIRARCNRHKDSSTLPQLCTICQRMDVEHKIVTKVVDTFLAAGWKVREAEDGKFSDSREETLKILFNLDDAHLIANKDREVAGWVRFVFGNDGFDVICDYSVNLEEILHPAFEYAATFDY